MRFAILECISSHYLSFFKIRYRVASEFYGFLIGAKGKTKNRIEKDTGVQLIIPRRGASVRTHGAISMTTCRSIMLFTVSSTLARVFQGDDREEVIIRAADTSSLARARDQIDIIVSANRSVSCVSCQKKAFSVLTRHCSVGKSCRTPTSSAFLLDFCHPSSRK